MLQLAPCHVLASQETQSEDQGDAEPGHGALRLYGHAGKAAAEWQRMVTGAKLARSAGLEVHAGHGLDYETSETISALPGIRELNIGYFMMGEALFVGLAETVRQMRAAMDRGRGRP